MSNTSEEKDLLHTAIANWAGFAYQGLCGVYHALILIKEDRESYKDYSISIDVYEDFAILNAAGLVVSLHQCKDVKSTTNFLDEQKKMKNKFGQYQSKGWLAEGCRMFFHSATQVHCEEGIEAYPYHNGATYCSPNDILRLIEEMIKDILPSDSDISTIVAILAAMVDAKVLYVHDVMHHTNELQKHVARRKAKIYFHDIVDVLFHTIYFTLPETDYFPFIRSKYSLEWLQLMSEAEEEELKVDKPKMENYITFLRNMGSVEGMELLTRILPHEKIAYSGNSLFRVVSPEKSSALFYVLHKINQPLEADNFDWLVNNHRLTPTAVVANTDIEMKHACRQIIDNCANLDCLREYDALVGNVHHSIDSISSETQLFSRMKKEGDERLHRSIFYTKDIGIKSIDDVNRMQ